MLPVLHTAPAAEPITLEEAKAHLRIMEDVEDDDDLITALIVAARVWLEEYLWRGIVTQTWALTLEEFPCEEWIELPKGGLASITSVTYVDTDGDSTVWGTSNYTADTISQPGRLRLAYDASWPSDVRDQWNAVTILYVVGWSVANVPKPLKQALLMLVSQMYEHRTPEVSGTITAKFEFAVEALCSPYRLARW